MKVILATESFAPNVSGVATATQNLAENLSLAGHEVWVFTPGNVLATKVDRNFAKYTVIRLKSIPNAFRAGYRITFIAQRKINAEVEKIQPDIIHLQDPASVGTLLRNAGRKFDIPVVITNHFSLEYALSYVKFAGPAVPLLKIGLVKYLVNFYNKCDQVVTPTETFRRQLESWGVKTPVRAVSNGIEVEKFIKIPKKELLEKTRENLHLPDNPLVLYLGRIDKDKSVDVIVQAIPEVTKRTNAHFVFAGPGDKVDEIKELAEELGISNKITFLGFLDQDSPDFIRLHQVAAVFVIASLIETQSIVTLEAMSSHLPIVAANANALPELVHNGENGFLFPPGNAKKCAEAIIKILQNNKMAERMGRASVLLAMHHQMQRAFGEMVELYKEVIERKGKSENK